MNLSVVGTGYVGLVAGACLSDSGHRVVCVDCDESKIRRLNSGEVPIFEPGLSEIVARNKRAGRLAFSTDLEVAIRHGRMIFVAVGTPEGANGEADLSAILSAASTIGKLMDGYRIVVMKSTVPVGTHRRVSEAIAGQTKHPFDYVSNPEFLKEGAAIEDFMRPDRVVIGTWNAKAAEVLSEIYEPLYLNETPMVKTTVESAELIKYAANAFLATKISFINEMANLCELVGADIKVLERGIGLDRRIGRKFLHAGAGYGGSCFPKDTEALDHLARSLGYPLRIVRATIEVNREQRLRLMARTERELEGVAGKTVAVLGLSFKPLTDDIRDSVGIDFLKFLRDRGAQVRAFDPIAIPNAQREVPDIVYTKDAWEAVKGADAAVIAVEWNEFRTMSLARVRNLMRGNLIVDLKNIYDPENLRALGFHHVGVGRGTPAAASTQA